MLFVRDWSNMLSAAISPRWGSRNGCGRHSCLAPDGFATQRGFDRQTAVSGRQRAL